MKFLAQSLLHVTLAAALSCVALAADSLYSNDLQQADLDSVPEDFLVIAGMFTVKEAEDNRFLELPGAPLQTFGFLFGPSQADDLAVSARIYGTRRGRLFPAFAVSLGGVGGHRLQVAPAKLAVELLRGDLPLKSVPYEWESGTWTRLKLQLRETEKDLWRLEGKVWPDTQPEPDDWTITLDLPSQPVSGRPGAWGVPFSTTPIRFDDLRVTRARL